MKSFPKNTFELREARIIGSNQKAGVEIMELMGTGNLFGHTRVEESSLWSGRIG